MISGSDPGALLETRIQCPFCWESITILVDPSCHHQQYIEDCQVCCRPIELTICTDSGCLSSVQTERAD
ncbi:MAG: CPXCG motif-containing cysteine-rich protein [Chromatiales bacterium]|nr:CPXCG motif-containing cysteine-rich protein [Chromatiales bacterium]MDH3894143.1 CPXCG motif-containing cysteine-rich protein [Chromatiales bacterium]MDH3930827.1 CPXCG motif-containing cysteine-rich protein [Chromatiales bacterium]MDH4012871.1 CPXCG motif-containing cysteine-rich protein [Chromatiales bacterium]PLX56352.1 MAG: CPXCG motif-containing cysteine-rich protein [Chromatiales bacterium]